MSAYGGDSENAGATAPDYGGPSAAPQQAKGTRMERARMLTTNTVDELARINDTTSKVGGESKSTINKLSH